MFVEAVDEQRLQRIKNEFRGYFDDAVRAMS
jgi:hypothetical protein